MAATWNITELERETTNQGVVVVHWRVSDEEVVGEGEEAVTHRGANYSSTSFTPDSSAEGFTEFDALTEADVVAWVKASLGEQGVIEVESHITAQITESKIPATATGLPW